MKHSALRLRVGLVLLIILLGVLLADRGGLDIFDNPDTTRDQRILEKTSLYAPGIELQGVTDIDGSKSIPLSAYVGKNVILLDFWSTSCTTCKETLPYLEQWNQDYKKQGLIIIGVHSHQFSFETSPTYVKKEAGKYNTTYPMVLDTTLRTWDAYENTKRPTRYLLDIDGFIRHIHEGPGGLIETEQELQKLLRERETVLNIKEQEKISLHQVPLYDPKKSKDIYLGSELGRYDFGNPQGLRQGVTLSYTLPLRSEKNKVYAEGLWEGNTDHITLKGETGKLLLSFNARRVQIVASSTERTTLNATIDDESYDIPVNEPQLYTLTTYKEYKDRTLSIDIPTGVRVYKITLE